MATSVQGSMDDCDACGFRAGDYAQGTDLPRTVDALPYLLAQMVAPVDPAVLAGLALPSMASDGSIESVHAAVHALRDLSRAIHAAGGGVPSHAGTVVQLSMSDGGVPKLAVPSVDVGRRGVVGDRQGDRKHHGRPFQALCLYSADVIDALRAEGNPIVPGAVGENITVAGIDWAALRPGVRLLIGQVLCETSAWAVPCRKNDQWFADDGTNRRSDRMDHDLHPGWSRIYAWVLEPGTIATGDPVVVEP